jgi:hypothetical protein
MHRTGNTIYLTSVPAQTKSFTYFRRIEMSNVTIKDLSRNEEMDSGDMAAIEGGITFPAVLNNVAPVKLIAPPQPVTNPSGVHGGGYNGGDNDGGGGLGLDDNGQPPYLPF